MAIGDVQLTRSFTGRKADYLATVDWTEGQVPTSARLLTFGMSSTFMYYSRLDTHDLFALSPADLARMLGDARPTFLLLDVDQVQTQWSGRTPANDYVWLRDGPGLTAVGHRGALTLFRVSSPSADAPARGSDVMPTALPANSQNSPYVGVKIRK
jgi:hypothetical protein